MAKRTPKKQASVSGVSTDASVKIEVAPGLAPWSDRDWLWGLLLVLAVILVYQPVWQAGFLWDDNIYITAGPNLAGLSGLKEIWTSSAADISPLTFTTFWVEHALWGLAPLPYHIVNVLLHGASAVVLWRVLGRLRVPGAWLGAALWALHPVEVESVAWITETKNTESGLFFLLSILFFIKGRRESNPDKTAGGGSDFALTLLFAALAMASKSSTVVLPVILCLCAWWMEGRWDWRHLRKIGPVFALSAVASGLALWTQKLQLATDSNPAWVRTWPERLVTAGDAFWFYLGKLVWPHPLITVYPRWQIEANRWASYGPLLAVLGVGLILWLKRGSWARPWFFVFVYFLVTLLPVLGLLDNYIFRFSLVFDHFQYLASMGPLALAGAALVRWAEFINPGRSWLVSIVGAGVLLLLGTLSWRRAWVFESEEALWTNTLAGNPGCWLADNNLGQVLLQKGWNDEAATQFRKGLGIYPADARAHNNLGDALLRLGQTDQAIAQWQTALALNPSYAEAYSNLGDALLRQGAVDRAVAEFQKALAINPNYAEAHNNLGNALLQKGEGDEAMLEYQKALELDPNYADAHYNLGKALFLRREVDQSITQFRQALASNPGHVEAHNNLGIALAQTGQIDEAMIEYQKALALDPRHYTACYNLGNALLQRGRTDEALAQFQQALVINPNFAEADNILATILLQKGDVDGAVTHWHHALTISPQLLGAHYNLGKILLQKGKTDEAITELQKAVDLNPNIALMRDSLGQALIEKGQVDDAIAQFREAVRVNPNDSEAQNYLARALQKTPVGQK